MKRAERGPSSAETLTRLTTGAEMPLFCCLLLIAALGGCAGSVSHQAPAGDYAEYSTATPMAEEAGAVAPRVTVSTASGYGEAEAGSYGDGAAPPAEPMMEADVSAPPSRSSRADRRADRRAARERSRRSSEPPAAPAPVAQPPASMSRPAPPPPPPAPSGGGVRAGGSVSIAAPAGLLPPPPPPPPPPAPVVRQVPVVQQLTAASVGDVDRRGPYMDYLGRHPAERAQIGLDMTRRVRFRVLDGQSRPLHDAVISLNVAGRQVEGRTHADGYWDYYPGVSSPGAAGQASATVRWRNQQAQARVVIPPQGDGPTVAIQLPQAAAIAPSTLDLAFLIDVTGSMGDELAYVNHEVMGIVQRVRQAVNQVNVRVAATFYRDRGDLHPLQQIPFSTNIQAFNTQMSAIMANGGGDYPEDLNAGLGAALTTLAWTDGPAVRVLVVISDAPPQQYPNTQYTYHHALVDASRRGIRVLPVAASGADRVVEYLFRAMGAFTSTPYVYLTDDSGIGGHHMEADTDRIAVEMFSDLLTRMLIADLQGQGMHEPSHDQQGQLVPGQ